MLRELRIRNFAVIESVAVEFRPGLNVLTGETGAGKSMLIDAILLVLGARAQTDVIRSDADAATVEAVFDVEPRGAVAATLDEAGLAPDDGVLVARRELSRSGRHRAFVNDAAVTVALLERDHESATARLHRATRILGDLARLDPSMAAPVEPIDAARAQLEDTLAAVRALRESVPLEPGRLEVIDERLDALTRLKRKYGDTEEAMLKFRDEVVAELDRLSRHEEVLAGEERRLGEPQAELGQAAPALSERRRAAAERLGPAVERELRALGMERSHFRIWLERAELEGLAGDARVEEIARMLAGERVTDTARGHARELLGASGPRERRA